MLAAILIKPLYLNDLFSAANEHVTAPYWAVIPIVITSIAGIIVAMINTRRTSRVNTAVNNRPPEDPTLYDMVKSLLQRMDNQDDRLLEIEKIVLRVGQQPIEPDEYQ